MSVIQKEFETNAKVIKRLRAECSKIEQRIELVKEPTYYSTLRDKILQI